MNELRWTNKTPDVVFYDALQKVCVLGNNPQFDCDVSISIRKQWSCDVENTRKKL